MNPESLWIWLYLAALDHAAADRRTLFHIRIDGGLLPSK